MCVIMQYILCAHPSNFLIGTKSVNNFLNTYFVIEETERGPKINQEYSKDTLLDPQLDI